MTRRPGTIAPTDLRCEACGAFPEAPRTRLTVASVATVLPIELLVHAVVLQTGLPYLAKVSVLALSATALVIWVAEPSVGRMLRSWLHAGELSRHRRLHSSPALWRARLRLVDEPGALQRITLALAGLDVNILSIQTQPLPDGVLDDLVVGAPHGVTGHDLESVLRGAGGREVSVSLTTPVSLTDGQTRVLNFATRVVGDPAGLPEVIAELLGADRADGLDPAEIRARLADGTVLKVPSGPSGVLFFIRERAPFTSVESARAHRLAELAEISEYTR